MDLKPIFSSTGLLRRENQITTLRNRVGHFVNRDHTDPEPTKTCFEKSNRCLSNIIIITIIINIITMIIIITFTIHYPEQHYLSASSPVFCYHYYLLSLLTLSRPHKRSHDCLGFPTNGASRGSVIQCVVVLSSGRLG